MNVGVLFYILMTLGIFGVILLFYMVLDDWLTHRELQRKLKEEREAGERG